MSKIIKIRIDSKCDNLIRNFNTYKKDMKKEQLIHNFLADPLDKKYYSIDQLVNTYLEKRKVSEESFSLLTIINNKKTKLIETKLFFDKWGTGTLMIIYYERNQEMRKPLMVYRVLDTLNDLDEAYIEIDKYGLTYYCSPEEATRIFKKA